MELKPSLAVPTSHEAYFAMQTAPQPQTTYNYFEKMLTRLYVVTLSGIALLVICWQLTVQQGLDRRFNDGRLISTANQQRMLAERVGKCALAIDASLDANSVRQNAKDMETALHDLKQNAEALRFGNSDLQLPDTQSGRNQTIFQRIDPDFQIILKAARAMVANVEITGYAPSETHNQSNFTAEILQSERRFADAMKVVVDEYQAGSESRIDELQNTELALLLATVLSLLLAGVVIFRPAISQVKAAIQLLEQTQGRLRSNEQRLSAILNSMAEGVIVVGRNGENLLINEAARRLHSVSSAKELNAKDLDFIARYKFFLADGKTELEEHELPAYLALAGNEIDQVELYLLPRDKSQKGFWVLATARPLRGDHGEIEGGLVVVQDITEKKLAEKRFNLFYSAADSELRTPLVAIKESLESIDGRQGNFSPDVKEKIRVGKVETERLVQLINELLDFPRLEAGTLELEYSKFNVKQMLEETIAHARDLHKQSHQNSRNIITLLSDDISIEADRTRFALVMQNLIANALEAIEAGVVEVAAHESGRNLRVAVVDRGASLRNESSVAPILDFDAPAQGTLGLSVCKRIVEKHGGAMGFDADVKKGSTFWFEVPLAKPKAKIIMSASSTSMRAMQPNQPNQSLQSVQPIIQPEKPL